MRTGRKFSFKSFVDFLDDYKRRVYTTEDAKRIMLEFLLDESFVEAMFDPAQDNTSPVINDQILQMYGLLGRKRIMKLIIDTLKEYGETEGYKNISRSVAAFIFTVCFKNSDANAQRMDELTANYNSGKITADQYEDGQNSYEEHAACISALLHITKKIVKKPAKYLARETNLPRNFLESALCYLPERKYVTKPQVSQYLDYIQNGLFPYVYRTHFNVDDEHVRWEPFFLYLFGEENIFDVCVAIFLTNKKEVLRDLTDDNDRYDDDAIDCWDSLTLFAVQMMEKAPDSVKSHLIEIYGKKLSALVKTGMDLDDLRLNILNIDENKFPSLNNVIRRYKNQFESIYADMGKPKTDVDAVMPILNN